jgi:tetratricopeptide (TPR) repeat protein
MTFARTAVLMIALIVIVFVSGAGSALQAAPSARQEVAAGWTAFEKEEWSEAEAAFRRAIEADPALAEAYQGLGETLLRQDREQEAARAIEEGLPYLGDDPTALRPQCAPDLSHHPRQNPG